MSDDWMTAHRGVLRWAAVGLPILLAAVLALLRDQLTPSAAAVVLVLAIVGASATGDRVAGVAWAVAAAVAFDFFLTVPYYNLSIYDRDNVELAIAFVVVGLSVTELALWGHRQQVTARTRSGYIDGVLGLSDVIATGSDAALPRTVAAVITTCSGSTEWPGFGGSRARTLRSSAVTEPCASTGMTSVSTVEGFRPTSSP